MKFHLESAELFIPDGVAEEEALSRTTHMAIGAHQDDLEIMAFDGILRCFQQADKWYTGVVVTNGAGSPRSGLYKNFTDVQMQEIRIVEQKKAALIGEYAAQILLDYPSAAVKKASDKRPVEDLENLLKACRPDIVYTHNLCDKHDTHIGVTLKVVEAIRSLPPADRPKRLFGCEVWRDLDWMVDEDKIAFNVSEHENLQMALLGVFDSQISGGKRYDLATLGRRRAHATYHASHSTDAATGINFGMELTPLIDDVNLDPADFALSMVDRFRADVAARIAKAR